MDATWVERGPAPPDDSGAVPRVSEGGIRGFDAHTPRPPRADSGPASHDSGRPVREAGRQPDADSAFCVPTHPDIEGPFYRPGIPVRSELDLYGEPGEGLAISGVVRDRDCRPIERAIVEIWSANTAGAYDTTSLERRYYGQVATGADGAYRFHTVLPARYLNGAQYRPRHVHLKVWLPSRAADGSPLLALALTTQIYFEGDPYNAVDPWWDPARTVALVPTVAGELASVFDVDGIGL